MIIMDFAFQGEEIVEAIEDGKIVKVSESYALKEGLPIIRRNRVFHKGVNKEDAEGFDFDYFKRPLKKEKGQVTKDLIDNFHWEIVRRRKYLNMSRKQLADLLGEREEVVKILENGVLPREDFVLVTKVQQVLSINLRKNKMDFGQDMRKLIETKKEGKTFEIFNKEKSEDSIEIIE